MNKTPRKKFVNYSLFESSPKKNSKENIFSPKVNKSRASINSIHMSIRGY